MSDKEEEIALEFTYKKQQIVPINNEPVYKDIKYVIFETNNPKFFIKTYVFSSGATNAGMASVFSKVTQALNTQTNNVLKIIDVKNHDPLVAMLMERYDNDLNELIENHYFTTNFDVYKFIYQMCMNIEAFSSAKLTGFVFNGSNLVLGPDLNFQLTHFDKNINEKTEQELGESSDILKNDLAPEYFEEGVYFGESVLWDFGVALHKVLTGRSFSIDYSNKKVTYSPVMESVNPVFKEILDGLTKWSRKERIKPSKVVSMISPDLRNLMEYTMNGEVDQHVQDFGALLYNFNDQIHGSELDEFPAKQLKVNLRQKRETGEILQLLLQSGFMINNDLLQHLIQRGWNNPKNHVDFYTKMFRKAKKNVKNNTMMLKLLLVLHAYMHRSSKKSLTIVNIDNKNSNLIENILDPLILAKISTNESVMASYAIFLLKKFKVLFKHIKTIGNNFSVSKIEIISRWPKILVPELFFDLLEYQQFVFAFILKIKQFRTNYFTKNILIFSAKEFVSVLGVIINLLTMVEYTLNFNDSLTEDERATVIDFIDYTMNVCNNNRLAVDLHLKTLVKLKSGYEVLDRFVINKNITEHYAFLRGIMKERIAYVEKKKGTKQFNIKDYTRYFMNYIVRMPEALQKISFNSQVQALDKDEILEHITNINTSFISAIRAKQPSELFVLLNLPNLPKLSLQPVSSKRQVVEREGIVKQKKDLLVIKEDDDDGVSNRGDTTMNDTTMNDTTMDERMRSPNQTLLHLNENPMKETYLMKLVPAKLKTISVGVQTDAVDTEQEILDLQKEIEEKEEEKQNLITQKEKEKEEPEPEPVEQEDEETGDYDLGKKGIENFIMNEFSRSASEWIVDFNELEFGKLIATGSTCHVYQAFYKNVPVAIKKLLKPENESKIKFLKEFKREISLLISLPSHPSLLNLIGFCIEDGVVYLLTEFCQGGTLFDILYRRSLGFKISM